MITLPKKSLCRTVNNTGKLHHRNSDPQKGGSVTIDTSMIEDAGAAWRSAVHPPSEATTQKLGLGGNLCVSAVGLLKAVFKVTMVVLTVKGGVALDPLKILKLPADVFSAGMAVLDALFQTMPSTSFFTAVVLSRLEPATSQDDVVAAVLDEASKVATGEQELPFYLFISKRMAEQVIKEGKADKLASALKWLAENGYVTESGGKLTFRDRSFDWGLKQIGS
jgi:hypothetical protein